ncbi:MAG TPA: SdpI family protein [Ktedonobacteraceae bacterium]|nr:SdpI family protein [Ktedonobacteraceae bacterium]
MSTDNNDEKIAPATSRYRFASPLIIAIIALQALVAIVSYPFLPDRIPSHWNAAGQIDAYAPKLQVVLLSPLLSIGIFVLLQVLLAASPRLGNQNPRANRNVINVILAGTFLFMLVIQLATTAAAFHVAIDISLIVSLAVSVLFIFIGNYMGKLRRNFWAGIRTPWTLTNETVWERTHRFGGWIFVIGGLVNVVLSFIPAVRFYGLLAIVLLMVLGSTVYSYVVYQRIVVHGEQRLSPPFD